jgi:hypothetical protein
MSFINQKSMTIKKVNLIIIKNVFKQNLMKNNKDKLMDLH